ncbi:hypothetical protein GCM10008983_05560 [Lentibacillus halophilus]|uniref:Uncharacterized protein n=1 Tax=Lentibacillus halophilus TaxID=295065 RepID=A0ABP3IXX6_9BACI
MNNNLWHFIGVQRKTRTDADKKVDLIMNEIFKSLDLLLVIKLENYRDIHQLIEEKRRQDNETAYFWDWLNEDGLFKIKQILQYNLADSEELHGFLDYRDMILKLDAESQIPDSLFTSIADTVTEIHGLIETISEETATIEEQRYRSPFNEEPIQYPIPVDIHQNEQQWVVNKSESPAGNSRTFIVV